MELSRVERQTKSSLMAFFAYTLQFDRTLIQMKMMGRRELSNQMVHVNIIDLNDLMT